MKPRVWLFDLDDTLHDASTASMPRLRVSFGEYIQQHLQLTQEQSDALRRHYWQRYGATLLGLVKHHAVDAAHFLHHTHLLPGLEDAVRGHAGDFAALRRLPGRKFILTNAPRAYAERVIGVLGIGRCFDGLISIEDMRMFGELRPKPDARMLRRLLARLRVPAARCVLVEDTLQHQKAARRVGMNTVWMQRWTRGAAPAGTRASRRPPYVDLKTRQLRALERRLAQCGHRQRTGVAA
ncbi:MAG TPA: pyrimidine 5'-nucleotidase [Rubrivivax sp.]|nr:pyrimidine 5'-nucleotidase [Rubrivivax sp.]